MEDDFYLNQERKSYYMEDFKNLLSYNDSDFWAIDNDTLRNILININQNENLQTLYSKSLDSDANSYLVSCNSYLVVAYAKEVKEKLNKSLVEIQDFFGGEAIVEVELPQKENPNTKGAKLFGIACIDDIGYFNIHCFKIELKSKNIASHKKFWQLLEKSLSTLT